MSEFFLEFLIIETLVKSDKVGLLYSTDLSQPSTIGHTNPIGR